MMDTKQYKIMIWKVQDRVRDKGPDYEYDKVASTEEDAIRTILRENKIEGKFYAEVHLNDGTDHCWSYTDEML